MFDALSTV